MASRDNTSSPAFCDEHLSDLLPSLSSAVWDLLSSARAAAARAAADEPLLAALRPALRPLLLLHHEHASCMGVSAAAADALWELYRAEGRRRQAASAAAAADRARAELAMLSYRAHAKTFLAHLARPGPAACAQIAACARLRPEIANWLGVLGMHPDHGIARSAADAAARMGLEREAAWSVGADVMGPASGDVDGDSDGDIFRAHTGLPCLAAAQEGAGTQYPRTPESLEPAFGERAPAAAGLRWEGFDALEDVAARTARWAAETARYAAAGGVYCAE